MNPEEYDNLEATEREHWYYAGKREVVRRWLERTVPVRPGRVLLDCGAGTGLFAQEMSADYRVLVLDDHEDSLRRLRNKFSPEQVLKVSADGIPLADHSVDVVTALDVLEHVERHEAVVEEFARVLRPGAVAVVTVPAGMALWSDWDVGLHHYRRYDRKQLRALFPEGKWDLIYVNYTNVIVYPAVWFVRKWRALRSRAGARTEDRVPARWLNALLRTMFVQLAHWRIPFPFGVSLVLVAKRRA